MTKIQSFRDRLVWQKAMTLAERCSRYSKRFGRDDQLVLGFEIRKSCVSIRRTSPKASAGTTRLHINHLWIAGRITSRRRRWSSRSELISGREAEVLLRDAEEIGRMTRGLIRSLERAPLPLPPFLIGA